MNKKRLLKDLPFSNLKSGNVLTKGNGGYYQERGEMIYSSGGSSHNGWKVLQGSEIDIIDKIWEDTEWFEDADLSEIVIHVNCNEISLSFKPLDLGQAQDFAKGVASCLKNFYGKEKGSYVWHQWNGFKISR